MTRHWKPWTPEEHDRCAELWRAGELTTTQIAEQVGRDGIRDRMTRHNVRRGNGVRWYAISRGAMWTASETRFLVEHWGAVSARVIAQQLNRPRNSVIGKAYRLRLRDAPVRRPLATKPVVVPPPPPRPHPVIPPADFTRRVCPCNNMNPCQPGRGLCASCLRDRMKPNPRASVFVSLVRSA